MGGCRGVQGPCRVLVAEGFSGCGAEDLELQG